ncbi:MAG: hypothetical protein WC682_03295 [Parcubacteria group bacterium]|jgi:hypothetical protein
MEMDLDLFCLIVIFTAGTLTSFIIFSSKLAPTTKRVALIAVFAVQMLSLVWATSPNSPIVNKEDGKLAESLKGIDNHGKTIRGQREEKVWSFGNVYVVERTIVYKLPLGTIYVPEKRRIIHLKL